MDHVEGDEKQFLNVLFIMDELVDLETIFDPKYLNYIDKKIALQDMIFRANEENWIQMAENIMKTDFVETNEGVDIIASNFFAYCRYKSLSVPYYIRICQYLTDHSSEKNYLNLLKTRLLDCFFQPTAYLNPSTYFLFEGFKINYFDIEQLIERIEIAYDKLPQIYNCFIFNVFAYFAPEIKSQRPDLFAQLNELIHDMQNYNDDFMHVSVNFFSSYGGLEDNDLALLKKHREYGYEPGGILESIVKDDIDVFQQCLAKPDFDYDQTAIPSIFYRSHLLMNEPSLLQFAILYNSTEIVKYLLNSDIDFQYKDKAGRNIVYFAVASGNIEILQILDSMNLSFEASPHVASCYHQFDILCWLMSTKYKEIDVFHKGYITIMHQAVSSNNLKGVLYCLENGFDLTKYKNNSPLLFGFSYKKIDSVELILNCKSFVSSLDDVIHAAFYSKYDIFKRIYDSQSEELMINNLLVLIKFACANSDQRVLEFLIRKLDAKQKNSMKTLINQFMLFQYGLPDNIKILLAESDININEFSQCNIYFSAISTHNHKLIQLLLAQKDFDLNYRDKDGINGFLAAVLTNEPLILKEIVDTPSFSLEGRDYLIATHFSQERNNYKCLDILSKFQPIFSSV